ncbi:MAG: hypothetical protein MZU79_08665 [Anaerotruncus sp.]|nr:hypothetical protein [Anaerotruncus sp.]
MPGLCRADRLATIPLDSLYPAFDGQAMNAAWIVEFGQRLRFRRSTPPPGQSTADYDRTMAILCHPLSKTEEQLGRKHWQGEGDRGFHGTR